ncbi:MAG: NUDIX hydrolase, partial [Bacteroidales bacterium]|nr:NUDIX hydrolase [Bacteroidales bacterium]
MQKYTIFNKHNKILITKTSKEEDLKDYQRIIDCDKDEVEQEGFSLLFSEKETENIVLDCHSLSVEDVFAKATKNLYHVFAAGGIVENENKELLFMFRNGYWDLPKGHWES